MIDGVQMALFGTPMNLNSTLSIETARAENAVAVSAAALRFRPKPEDCVEGEVPRGRKIWTVGDGGKLEPHLVADGVSDGAFVQIENGDALEGREAVIGYETTQTAGKGGDAATNPFMPKRPKRGTAGTAPEPKKDAVPKAK